MINRNFLIIVVGQIISLFGSAIQRFCMSLYLLDFTGSTATFANILAISTLPYILFAPIAGRLSDRVNRKKIMVYLDFICAVVIGLYALILFQGKDHTLIVGVVMFLLSTAATLYGPAVTASIPQIVEEEHLTSANGIVNQVGSIVNFAGPIIAGILYGILGIKVIVAINAVSFLLSAIMELFLDIPDIQPKEVAEPIDNEVNAKKYSQIDARAKSKEDDQTNVIANDKVEDKTDSKTCDKVDDINGMYYEKACHEGKADATKMQQADEGFRITEGPVKSDRIAAKKKEKFSLLSFIGTSFKDMKENFIYLKKEKQVVLGIIASYALCNIFLVPILSIVAPYFINVKLGLSSQVYGIVEGICVLGMILGGMLISVKPKLFTIKKLHYTCYPMIGGVLLLSAIGFMKANAYALAFLFGVGGMAIMFSIALSNVLTLTFIQKEVPAKMLGRVSAFSTAVATVSVAPGQLLYGQLIEMGIPLGILLLATAVANLGLILFIKWNVRNVGDIKMGLSHNTSAQSSEKSISSRSN